MSATKESAGRRGNSSQREDLQPAANCLDCNGRLAANAIITWQDEICHVCCLPLRLSVCLPVGVSSTKIVRSLASLVMEIISQYRVLCSSVGSGQWAPYLRKDIDALEKDSER